MAESDKVKDVDVDGGASVGAGRRRGGKPVVKDDATVDVAAAGAGDPAIDAAVEGANTAPAPGDSSGVPAPIDPISARPEVLPGKGNSPVGTPPARLAPDYEAVRYVDFEGNEITSADGLFEDFGSEDLVRVTGRVSELVGARNARDSHRRLLWPIGAEIPKQVAESFKATVGGK